MADAKKYLVKNTSPGPRGLHTDRGMVFLEPGESRPGLAITDAELAGARSTGYFDILDEADMPADVADMTEEQLRAFLAERDGKAPHPAAKLETLLAKARGE